MLLPVVKRADGESQPRRSLALAPALSLGPVHERDGIAPDLALTLARKSRTLTAAPGWLY